MGYEILVTFHPRKEDGSYDRDKKEEQVIKVGKPFDDTPLERLAGVIMAQMARRDIWVLDVEPTELIRNSITFKECKDGKGIILKNKKYAFNEAAQLVAEDMGQPDVVQAPVYQQSMQPHELQQLVVQNQNGQVAANGQHPHEVLTAHRQQQNIDDLYANPNRPVPIQRQTVTNRRPVNQKKVIYKVYLEPDSPYRNEVRRLPCKLSYDREYPVHEVIPSPTGRLDAQRLAITDDTGKVVEIDEKYFTSAGMGLVEDHDGRFSGNNNNRRGVRKPKLAFEDEMFMEGSDPKGSMAIPSGIPVDDGSVPADLLRMPDIRPGKLAR